MKKIFTLTTLALLLGMCGLSAAVIGNGVYSISCVQTEGYVALGAKHDMAPYICYINDGGAIAADGYWVVTNTASGYTFRNEVSGEYLVYTDGRVDQYYKWMTLSSSPESPAQYWTVVDNGDGSVSIQSKANQNYWWNLRAGQGMLGTYSGSAGTSANEHYVFTPKGNSPEPGPDPEPDPVDPETMTEFPAALHVYLNDGRIEAYPMDYVTSNRQTGGKLVIETNIGKTFTYALSDVDHVSETAPTDFPMFESFKFNNKFNDQLFTDALGEIVGDKVNVTVAAIGKRLTPSFKVPDDQTLVYVNGELQDSKVSRLRFDKDIYYVVTRPGVTMLLPKDKDYAMQPYGRMVCVHVDWLTDRAQVPTIYINTDDGGAVTSKDYYKEATISIDGHDIFPSMDEMVVQIKGRGNTSWNWPKKPYRLKFAEKVKPLGMTKGKSWVLLSNYQTGSLMSNAIGMKAANLMGASAANHIVPVDLYLNGEYRGSYNLTEKVGLSNNSVDLDDEGAAALLELDSYYDEPTGQKFRSSPYNLPVNIKDPDFSEGTTRLTLDIVRNNFNSFMSTLYRGNDISRYVDKEQMVRFLMVNELINNYELFHPKSTFCYRESFESDTSKYVFGPVWDLDWAFGYEGHSRYYQDNSTTNFWIDAPGWDANVKRFWQELRWKYDSVNELYKELWEQFLENDLQELTEYAQDYYDFAHNSFNDNRNVWGDRTNYEQQATQAANWIQTRANKIYQDILNDVKPKVDKGEEPVGVELANNRLYTLTCRRGGLVLDDAHEGLDVSNVRTWAPTEDRRFAILNIQGNYYLYSPVTKAFLNTSTLHGQWLPQLGSPIYFDDSNPDEEYVYMISTLTDDGSVLHFNNSTTQLVINSWDIPDDGDRWKIEDVGSFDPTEALLMAEGSMYDITMNIYFDGQIVGSQTTRLPRGAEMPLTADEWENSFVELNPIGDHPWLVSDDTTINFEAKWNGPFAFTTSLDNAHWYTMSVRSSYIIGKQDAEPYKPAVVTDNETLAKAEYQWAFGGNPYHVKVYNRSSGLDETLTNDGGNVVMRPGDYTWDLLANNDGFTLRVEGTPYTCVSQYGGTRGSLKVWNSKTTLTDNVATLRVTPAPALEDGILDIAASDGLNPTSDTAWFDLSGRKIADGNTPKAKLPRGIYIVDGRKVIVK